MLLEVEIKAYEVNVGDIILGNKCEGPVESVKTVPPHVMIIFKSGEPKATEMNFPLTILTEVEI